jgi:hypothetical protein
MKPDILSTDMTTLGASLTLGPPVLRKACVIRADLGSSVEFATTQGATRAMFPIAGGEARGEGWTARILPGGADFALGLSDGSYLIEARYCLEFDDGTPVFVTNAGKMADAVYFGTALAPAGDDEHVFIELWEAQI